MNMEKRQRFPTWAISILLLAGSSRTKECEQTHSGYARNRIFFALFQGPPSAVGDEKSAAKSLGSCRTTGEHAEKMFEYFAAYGADLGPMRRKPYEIYETAEFSVTPYVVDPNGSITVILNTFYEYAQVTNSPAMFSCWALKAKADVNGPEKSLSPGYWAIYCMMRFSDRGRDFCFEFTSWNPLAPLYSGHKISTLYYRLWNEDWGIGNLTGTITEDNGVFTGHYIFQF